MPRKGKYLITLSFTLKCHNRWIYLRFKNNQNLMNNGGFYMPQAGVWTPFTLQKVYTAQGEETINFAASNCNSYSVSIINAIVTARPLPPE